MIPANYRVGSRYKISVYTPHQVDNDSSDSYFTVTNNVTSLTPTVSNFEVSGAHFLASGTGLSRVEIWSVPTGTGVTSANYRKIGEMPRPTTPAGRWTLAVSGCPILSTGIFARGYGADGRVSRDVYLPYQGATDLNQYVCGEAYLLNP